MKKLLIIVILLFVVLLSGCNGVASFLFPSPEITSSSSPSPTLTAASSPTPDTTSIPSSSPTASSSPVPKLSPLPAEALTTQPQSLLGISYSVPATWDIQYLSNEFYYYDLDYKGLSNVFLNVNAMELSEIDADTSFYPSDPEYIDESSLQIESATVAGYIHGIKIFYTDDTPTNAYSNALSKFVFSDGSYVYTFTLHVPNEDYSQYATVFEKILNSIEIRK